MRQERTVPCRMRSISDIKDAFFKMKEVFFALFGST